MNQPITDSGVFDCALPKLDWPTEDGWYWIGLEGYKGVVEYVSEKGRPDDPLGQVESFYFRGTIINRYSKLLEQLKEKNPIFYGPLKAPSNSPEGSQ